MIDEKAMKILENFAMYKGERARVWDKIAGKAYRFYWGDQWSLEDKNIMLSRKRAPAVFNHIMPTIDLIVGHQIQTRVDLVAKPVDRFADPIMADVLSSVIKNIEWMNNATLERRFQFLDGLISGFGALEMWYDFDRDLEGELRVKQLSPWHFYLDPDFEKYDYTDARMVFKETWMHPDDALIVYGKSVMNQVRIPDVDGIYGPTVNAPPSWDAASNDYGNRDVEWDEEEAHRTGYDKHGKRIRILEMYTIEHERVEYVYDPRDGMVKSIDDFPEITRGSLKSRSFKRNERHVHLKTLVGDSVIAVNQAIRATEFNQVFNFYFPYFVNGKYWGAVENLFYPQEDINAHYSTIIHIVSSLANSGILYEDGAFPTEIEDDLEELLAINGTAIKLNEGGLAKIKEREKHEAPVTFQNMIASKGELVKFISGAHDAIAGQAQRQESGRAKEALINQSAMKLTGIIDNFRESQRLCGKAYLEWIRNYYTEPRLVRILGIDGNRNMQEVELNKQAFGKIFNDVSIGKYDVTLDFEGKTQSERERNARLLVELANTVPQFADIIGRLVLEHQAIPFKDQILAEWAQRQQQLQQAQQMAAMQGQTTTQAGGARGGIQGAPRPSSGPRRQMMQ